MTLREAEQRQRPRSKTQRPQKTKQRPSPQAKAPPIEHRDRVLSFRDWCRVNSFSPATGGRILASGDGPPVVQLSPRRIGIKESANAAWQAARTR
jgi:hypothetical protein